MARFDPTSTATGAELAPRNGDADAVIHVPTSAPFYEAAIEGLTKLNEEILASSATPFPPIYESGVGYRKEDVDTWRHCDDVLCSGWGDCEDLSAWRAAELRHSGEDPDARVYVYRSGERRFHAVVARGDGRLEDPSLILGMKVSDARRASLPRWEGQTEMTNTDTREFGTCAGAGEDLLSRSAIGDPGALLTDPPGTSGFFSSMRRAAGRTFGAPARAVSRGLTPSFFPRPNFSPSRPIPFVSGEDDGTGDMTVAGMSDADRQDEMLAGEDDGGTGEVYDDPGYADDGGYYADGGDYVDELPPEELPPEEAPQEQASGPNPIEQAMASAGRGIKSAASSAWGVTKDIFSPISFAAKTAIAPIRTVAKAAQLSHKYLTMPTKALNKVFSFLGGVDEVHPDQVGVVDDEEYQPGDEDFFRNPDEVDYDEETGEEIRQFVPPSQTARFRTEEVSPGIYQGQVILPTREPGKSITLTTTPAPDEQSAGDRMYNLALKAANTPAMMALTNPLAFAVLMTMKGTSKVPFGSAFKAIGSGVATAARAVGRGAESIANTATSW